MTADTSPSEKVLDEFIKTLDFGQMQSVKLVERGLVPHTRPVPMSSGEEVWWEYPKGLPEPINLWVAVAAIAIVLTFFLFLAKGVPWA